MLGLFFAIDASVSGDQSSADAIARALLDLTNEIDVRIAGDTRLLTTSLSIDLRYWLKLNWQNFGDSLLESARELTQHATSLEEQLAANGTRIVPQVKSIADQAKPAEDLLEGTKAEFTGNLIRGAK